MKNELEKVIEYYDNGQKKKEYSEMDGEFEGDFITYYENGQKKSKESLSFGMSYGRWTKWYENGQKKSEGDYFPVGEQGRWTYWDEEGNVTKTETYKDGELVKPYLSQNVTFHTLRLSYM